MVELICNDIKPIHMEVIIIAAPIMSGIRMLNFIIYLFIKPFFCSIWRIDYDYYKIPKKCKIVNISN